MPNAKLTELMREGMSVYPTGMSAVTQAPGMLPAPGTPRVRTPQVFRPINQGKVWGGSSRARSSVLSAAPETPKPIPPARNQLQERNRARMAAWFKENMPTIYKAAVARLKDSDRGVIAARSLGQTTEESPGFFDKLLGTIQTLAPELIKARAQKELLDVQLDRARQGLPPLDTTQYAPAVQVSMDPETIYRTASAASPMLWGVPLALLAGFLLLGSKKGRGRR